MLQANAAMTNLLVCEENGLVGRHFGHVVQAQDITARRHAEDSALTARRADAMDPPRDIDAGSSVGDFGAGLLVTAAVTGRIGS